MARTKKTGSEKWAPWKEKYKEENYKAPRAPRPAGPRNHGGTDKQADLPFIRINHLARSRKGILVYKKSRKPREATGSEYSDRLYQRDGKKFAELSNKYFPNAGHWWSQRKIADIESFLSDFLGRKIILCAVYQFENASSGYPLWRFDFRHRYPSKTKSSAQNGPEASPEP
jgi:hypothetical protein